MFLSVLEEFDNFSTNRARHVLEDESQPQIKIL